MYISILYRRNERYKQTKINARNCVSPKLLGSGYERKEEYTWKTLAYIDFSSVLFLFVIHCCSPSNFHRKYFLFFYLFIFFLLLSSIYVRILCALSGLYSRLALEEDINEVKKDIKMCMYALRYNHPYNNNNDVVNDAALVKTWFGNFIKLLSNRKTNRHRGMNTFASSNIIFLESICM